MPPEREAVVIASAGGAIARLRVAFEPRTVGVVESVTVTVSVKLPATLGVPVIWPVGLRASPAGNPVAVKVYGVVPPIAANVAL